MKHCHQCEVMSPDHAHHCPPSRRRQRRGEWQLQAVLLLAATAAAIAVLAEAC